MHRLLPPSAIAGVSLLCAVGPWLFTDPSVLRGLAAAAALTTVVGSVVMRRWDTAAGKRVAELTRARASDEWRYEERVAELETDLEESRELRSKLEHRLRAKRTELAGLRNEHAALLRRYATAETERATALESRRVLAIETAVPARALTAASADRTAQVPGAVASPGASGAAASGAAVPSAGPVSASAMEAARTLPVPSPTPASGRTGTDLKGPLGPEDGTGPEGDESGVDSSKPFSPTGSSLFLRANSALDRIVGERAANLDAGSEPDSGTGPGPDPESEPEPDSGSVAEPELQVDADADADNDHDAEADAEREPGPGTDGPGPGGRAKGPSTEGGSGPQSPVAEGPAGDTSARRGPVKDDPAQAASGPAQVQEDEAEGKSEAADGHRRAAAAPSAGETASATVRPVPVRPPSTRPAPARPPGAAAPEAAAPQASADEASAAVTPVKPTKPVKSIRPSGHFAVPTAVAVVPNAPRRRRRVEGGFDFFGTQQGTSPDALEAVQNEDLADVVGQEALALHKAESEAVQFKPADEESRGVGQVIDLTAHDETERIDLAGLRSAVS
ncbi:hypothetical protein [Streptomyces sp. NPDC005907]|uniref:hypothetical protein n=1 Tax=Streptomyces sp. NPDC005907 TaxID=3154571 RepID=UPI0033E0DA13